jgi:GDP-D-mannose dehydratase
MNVCFCNCPTSVSLSHFYPGPNKFHLHYGDLSDSTNLVYIIAQVQPTEVYNLGAQSHVKVSFEMAEYTVRHNRQVVQ